MAFEFGAFHEGLATLCTDVHAGSVGVEVLPHGRVIPEHLCAALQRHLQHRVNRQQLLGGSLYTGILQPHFIQVKSWSGVYCCSSNVLLTTPQSNSKLLPELIKEGSDEARLFLRAHENLYT